MCCVYYLLSAGFPWKKFLSLKPGKYLFFIQLLLETLVFIYAQLFVGTNFTFSQVELASSPPTKA